MTNYTRIIPDSEIHNKIYEQLNLVKSEIYASKPHVRYDDEGNVKLVHWSPQTVFKNIKPGVSNVVRRIILDASEKSEKIAPGTGEDISKFIVDAGVLFLSFLIAGGQSQELEKQLQNDARELLKAIQGITMEPNSKNVTSVLNMNISSPSIRKMMQNALDLGGVESKISIATETSSEMGIKINRGFTFLLEPYAEFLSKGNWNKEQAKVLIVDGIVERVAEIHSILSSCADEKTSLIIFARGFGEEVIATLHVNFLRGTLDVLPVRVPFNEVNANTLNDIAVVVDSDVISALKGELISAAQYQELPFARLTTQSKKIMLAPKKINLSRLKLHIKNLEESLEKFAQEDQFIINDRLKSLNSMSTEITLSFEHREKFFELDATLKMIKNMISNGCILSENYSSLPMSRVGSILVTILEEKMFEAYPAKNLLSIVKLGTQAVCDLMRIKSIIVVDENP